MTTPNGTDNRLENPIMAGGMWDTQHMSAVVVFAAMLFLFLIRRGFRGLSVGGLSVGIR